MIAIWINKDNKNIRIAGGFLSEVQAFEKAYELAMELRCLAYLLDEEGIIDRIDGRV